MPARSPGASGPGTLFGHLDAPILPFTSGFAQAVAEDVPFRAGDVLLIFSASGWNAVPVESAQAARARQVYIIAFTSKEYLKLRDEKHKQHLSDVADLVVDTHVPVGDVAVATACFTGGNQPSLRPPVSPALKGDPGASWITALFCKRHPAGAGTRRTLGGLA